jgi:hypothetical protein
MDHLELKLDGNLPMTGSRCDAHTRGLPGFDLQRLVAIRHLFSVL